MFKDFLKRVFEKHKTKTNKIFNKGFKFILPHIYLKSILLGFVLAGFYTIFPKLIFCGSFFGDQFCMPLGLFLAMIASIPGYFIGGNILKFFPKIPVLASMSVVFFVSLFFYRYLGKLIDKLRKGIVSTEERVKIVVIISFFVLGLLLISLI